MASVDGRSAASVVRGECAAQEQAEQSHLHTKERGGLARQQDHQQHGELSAEASKDECRLGRSVSYAAALVRRRLPAMSLTARPRSPRRAWA